MKTIIIALIFGLFLSSCTYYVYPPKVKESYKYSYSYKPKLFKNWENSRWRKHKRLMGFIKYDKNGNEIEVGAYGERWCKTVSKELSDSTIQIIQYCGYYPKKLNTVHYKEYNDSNLIVREEVWSFSNNKKNKLVYRTEYIYSNKELIKETDYDANGIIIRKKSYSKSGVSEENSSRTIFKPIVRVEGESKDSIMYDSLGRELEKYHYFRGKFLRRTVWVYNDDNNIVTEYMYNEKPDSLWSYTETRYDYFTKRPLRKYWKVLNSTTERRTEYIYDRKKLLHKIKYYGVDIYGKDELNYYTRYRYKLY